MPAHLTLVADNSAPRRAAPRGRAANRAGDSPDATDPGADTGPGRAARSWVHAEWAPPPTLRRLQGRVLGLTRLLSRAGRSQAREESAARAVLKPVAPVPADEGGAKLAEERGAVTAEYALVIMAAVAFAGLLVAIMRSSEVRQMLVELVQNALGSAG